MEIDETNCEFSAVLSGRKMVAGHHQTLRVWLISGCAFGTNHCGPVPAKGRRSELRLIPVILLAHVNISRFTITTGIVNRIERGLQHIVNVAINIFQ